jgi:proline iminopeptidase
VILAGVGTTTAAEVDWITRSMGRVFPEAWERFVDGVPEGERDGNLAAAYARLLRSPDAAVREEAARRWCEWEDTHVSTYPGWTHDTRYDDPVFRMCFARLVTHYWANAAFLPDGRLMDGVHRIAHIPAVLVSGRLDVSSPPEIAWRLCRRWPAAELVLVAEGHPGGASTTEALLEAARRFAPSRGTGSRSAADLSIPSQ